MPRCPPERCLPLWQLAAAWVLTTTILSVLAVRWIGWTDGPMPVPEAWALAAPALALIAGSLFAFIRSILRQHRAERLVGGWVASRLLPLQPSVASVASDARIQRCRLVDEEQPYAFTFGVIGPTVVVTSGLVHAVDGSTLRAILLHEAAHAHAHDPARLMLARALAAGLFAFPPAVRAENRCHQWIELAADRASLSQLGRGPVATALLTLLQPSQRLRERTRASVVEAGDLIPARVLQLSRYPKPVAVPPVSGRREKVSTAALFATVAATAALPCAAFTAAVEHISRTSNALW
jgi:Zn-dependent protease with chaperone function